MDKMWVQSVYAKRTNSRRYCEEKGAEMKKKVKFQTPEQWEREQPWWVQSKLQYMLLLVIILLGVVAYINPFQDAGKTADQIAKEQSAIAQQLRQEQMQKQSNANVGITPINTLIAEAFAVLGLGKFIIVVVLIFVTISSMMKFVER